MSSGSGNCLRKSESLSEFLEKVCLELVSMRSLSFDFKGDLWMARLILGADWKSVGVAPQFALFLSISGKMIG